MSPLSSSLQRDKGTSILSAGPHALRLELTPMKGSPSTRPPVALLSEGLQETQIPRPSVLGGRRGSSGILRDDPWLCIGERGQKGALDTGSGRSNSRVAWGHPGTWLRAAWTWENLSWLRSRQDSDTKQMRAGFVLVVKVPQ